MAALLIESCTDTLGAERIKVSTFVVAGLYLDLSIHLWAITPAYFPLLSTTIKTGVFSSLIIERHTESVSSFLTLLNFVENTSLTTLETSLNYTTTPFSTKNNSFLNYYSLVQSLTFRILDLNDYSFTLEIAFSNSSDMLI